jgi:hypothetical protein
MVLKNHHLLHLRICAEGAVAVAPDAHEQGEMGGSERRQPIVVPWAVNNDFVMAHASDGLEQRMWLGRVFLPQRQHRWKFIGYDSYRPVLWDVRQGSDTDGWRNPRLLPGAEIAAGLECRARGWWCQWRDVMERTLGTLRGDDRPLASGRILS